MNDTPNAWDLIQIDYVEKLMEEYKIKNFFETGTYLGQTSLYFKKRGLRIFTVESNRGYYEEAKASLGPEVSMYLGDSREYLRQYVESKPIDTFYYLDAHWGDLPVSNELQILSSLDRYVAMLHDVEVPGRPQFIFERDVTGAVQSAKLERDLVKIYPKYHIPMLEFPGYLVGYCIILKNYPVVDDVRFSFEKEGGEWQKQ